MVQNPPAPITPEDEAAAARAVLSDPVWAFITGAAGSREVAKHANREAWDEVFLGHLLPRDVSRVSTATSVLGAPAAAPFAVAPMGLPARIWPHGDLEIAAACAETGIPLVVSTMASARVEDIAKSGARCAFQLYWLRDPRARRELVRRAEQAGCSALVITTDAPVRRGSERERAAEFSPGADVAPAMTDDVEIDPSLDLADVEAVVGATSMPVYVKGVLSAATASRCREAGAAGVVVSNHGGRQLPCAVPTATALEQVVRHGPGGLEVLVDGGISTGTDVLRSLALGATGALVGRQVLYGLGRSGMQGVLGVLQRISAELAELLALTGCPEVADVARLPVLIRP
ncbi:alpha-hydroxy acid oxidase [Saccharopolyspora cebuensis]|uniref:Alpha-hydroxy acid oxidase n=1 Tax=Saccharopolyspora cebuensis TaxID=418759 RepID=A0ABV4CTD2_9PSEU